MFVIGRCPGSSVGKWLLCCPTWLLACCYVRHHAISAVLLKGCCAISGANSLRIAGALLGIPVACPACCQAAVRARQTVVVFPHHPWLLGCSSVVVKETQPVAMVLIVPRYFRMGSTSVARNGTNLQPAR